MLVVLSNNKLLNIYYSLNIQNGRHNLMFWVISTIKRIRPRFSFLGRVCKISLNPIQAFCRYHGHTDERSRSLIHVYQHAVLRLSPSVRPSVRSQPGQWWWGGAACASSTTLTLDQAISTFALLFGLESVITSRSVCADDTYSTILHTSKNTPLSPFNLVQGPI